MKTTTNKPAQKIGAALVKRGFMVTVEEDRIVFSAGNGKQDYRDARQLLEFTGVPVCYSGLQMQILSPVITPEVLRMIEKMPVPYNRAAIPLHFHTWKAFTKRNHGVRWNSLSLDRGIALLVKAMSAAGVLVTGGCDGHRTKTPQVYFASEWAAAWFNIVQERYLNVEELAYNWQVVIDGKGSPRLQASLGGWDRWTLPMIQSDTVKMGLALLQMASELRGLRRDIFKNRSMREQAESLKNDFPALCQWMNEMIEKGAANV